MANDKKDEDRSVPMLDKSNYLTEEQVKRVLDVAKKDLEWLLIYLLWKTGRRISELLKLKPQDINYDHSTITWAILKKTKIKKYTKIIAADHYTMKTLLNWVTSHKMKEDDYFFISKKKNKENEYSHLTRKWAFETVRRLTKIARVLYNGHKTYLSEERRKKNGDKITYNTGWHPHHFRHSFSINFLRKVKDPSGLIVLKQQLDHSSTKVTEHYLQFSQESRVELLNKIYENEN